MNVAKTFSILFMLFSMGGLSIIFYFNVDNSWQLKGWGNFVSDLMLMYLLFIFLRTLAIVVCSFFEYLFFRKIEKPSFHPLVTVLIPSFNEANVIRTALKSIQNINYPNLEIIVIDDGSLDITTEIAQEFERKGQLRVVYKENGGKADALNRGISEALGEYVLCMDADSVLNEDVLMHAMGYFERVPDLAAVAGRVDIGNSHNFLLKFQQLEYVTGLNLFKRAQSLLNMVMIVPGPIGVFKLDILKKVGGYHTNTFAEDADLTLRLLTKGYRIKYSPEMVATTEGPEDFSQLMIQRYRWSRGMVQAIMKNVSWLNPFRTNMRNFFIISYIAIETILIPTVNFAFALLTIQYALSFGVKGVLGAYFIGLTILDLALSFFSMVTEKKVRSYFLLALINRLTYGFSLEVIRFFSIIDEQFKIPMKWGTLQRKGMEVSE